MRNFPRNLCLDALRAARLFSPSGGRESTSRPLAGCPRMSSECCGAAVPAALCRRGAAPQLILDSHLRMRFALTAASAAHDNGDARTCQSTSPHEPKTEAQPAAGELQPAAGATGGLSTPVSPLRDKRAGAPGASRRGHLRVGRRLHSPAAGGRRRLRPNAPPRVCQLRRRQIRPEEPGSRRRADRRGRPVGLHQPARQQLASAYLALPCTRLPALRARALGASPDQRPTSRRHGGPPLPRAAANDRGSLAQCLRGRRLRHPSSAGRIGGLGGRTKGRFERAVLHAYPRRVCGLCASSVFLGALPSGYGTLRLGADGQADAGYAALRVAAFGLLAVAADSSWFPSFGMGTCRTFGRQLHCHPRAKVQLSPQRMAVPPCSLFSWQLFLEKLPLLLLSAASCAATLWAQGEAIAATQQVSLPCASAMPRCRMSPTWDSCSGRLDWRCSIRIRVRICRCGKLSRQCSRWRRSAESSASCGGGARTCWWAGSGTWACCCR